MMFEIIGGIAIIYVVHKFIAAFETMAKDYDEKINNGWIDCRSNVGFRA